MITLNMLYNAIFGVYLTGLFWMPLHTGQSFPKLNPPCSHTNQWNWFISSN